MINKKDLNIARQLIAQSELGMAIEKMQTLFQASRHENMVLQFSARYQDLKRQMMAGTISQEDKELSRNKLTAAILDLIRMAEKELEDSGEETPTSTKAGGNTINVSGDFNNSGQIILGKNVTINKS